MMWNDGRNTKCEYYETHKKTVCYAQTLCNLAAIVEQRSDCIKLLKEKVERLKKVECIKECVVFEDDASNKSGTTNLVQRL